MQTICYACLGMLILAGCQRSPYERQVYEDARIQAQLNAENYERGHANPPREPLPPLVARDCPSMVKVSQ